MILPACACAGSALLLACVHQLCLFLCLTTTTLGAIYGTQQVLCCPTTRDPPAHHPSPLPPRGPQPCRPTLEGHMAPLVGKGRTRWTPTGMS